MLLIKKFNSPTAALASQHSEVCPCESWRHLIRLKQIPCWGWRRTGRHRGSTKAQLEGMASCLRWVRAHLATHPTPPPVSQLSRVTGSQSGGRSQRLSCPWSSWERKSRAKQGINIGFRLSTAGLGRGSMSPLRAACHRSLSYTRGVPSTLKHRTAAPAVPAKSCRGRVRRGALTLPPWKDINI